MFRNIVVGYDATDHARDAAVLAEGIARASGATLHLVDVFSDIPAVLPADALRSDLRKGAMRNLEDAAHRIPSELAVTRSVVGGRSPARGLYEHAEKIGADLIVVGSTRDAGDGQVRGGRVAFQLLSGAPCAIAVAPAGLRAHSPLRLRTIGVGFDGRDESKAALAAAGSMVEEGHERLVLIAAVEPVEATMFGPYTVDLREAVAEAVAASAREALEAGEEDAPAGADVVCSLVQGHAATALVEEAAQRDLDLLAVGSRGFGPVRRVLLGSVSSELLRRAPCPLLIVPRGAPQAAPAGGGRARSAALR